MAKGKKRRAAMAAAILAQIGRSPELTRLVILLIILGHWRLRPGPSTIDPPRPGKTDAQAQTPKGKGFSIRRPRSRFL